MANKMSIDEIRSLVEGYRDEAVALLQKAVQTPSPTGQEKAMSDFFAAYMEGIGLEVQRCEYEKDRPNLLAEWVGNRDGKQFIFNGHMDVFPPTEGAEGEFDIWSGAIKDGKLYGRGSVDMKSGDCAALMAVRILKEKGYVPDGRILLSYMVDEENDSSMGVLSLLKNGLLRDGDFGICMEPSSAAKITMEEGGVWQAEITYLSSGGHTTSTTTETDALAKSIRAITALYGLKKMVEQRYFPGLGHPFLQINTIHAGTVGNVRASKSTFSIDRRFSSVEGLESVKKEIFEVLDSLKVQDPEYDYTLKEICCYPGAKRDENSEAVKLIIQACEDIQGKKVERGSTYGGSDSQHIMDQTPIQMPIYGPGDIGLVYTADEHVSIEEYLSVIMVYIRALDLLLGQKAD